MHDVSSCATSVATSVGAPVGVVVSGASSEVTISMLASTFDAQSCNASRCDQAAYASRRNNKATRPSARSTGGSTWPGQPRRRTPPLDSEQRDVLRLFEQHESNQVHAGGLGGAEALRPPGQRPLVLDHHRDAVQGALGGGVEHLARALGEGLDDGVDRWVALLDPLQRRVQQLGRGRPRRRRSPPPARAAVRSSASLIGRRRPREVGVALGATSPVSSASSSRIGGQKSAWAAPITASSISSASMPSAARPAGMNRLRGARPPSASQPYSGDWPGSCKRPARPHSAGGERQDRCRNWGQSPVCCLIDAASLESQNRPPARLGAARRSPACSPAWSRSPRPAPPTRRPLRVVVLGQTAETPPASCPGKIVNSVEITPCRVEGHVTGFQAIAGGVARPYEAPFEGKDRRLVDHPRPALDHETDTTTDEVGFFNDFLGQPSQARIGVLRPIEEIKPPKYKLVRQSPLQILNPYFGMYRLLEDVGGRVGRVGRDQQDARPRRLAARANADEQVVLPTPPLPPKNTTWRSQRAASIDDH